MSDGHDAHDGDHDIHPPSYYIKIWAVLLVLLVISVLGPELEIQIVTLITAFGIAFVKAYLVVQKFMHLELEKPIIKYILGTCLVFMVLFFAGTAPDVMNHSGTRWTNEAAHNAISDALANGDEEHHGDEHGDDHAPAHGSGSGAHASGSGH